MRSHRIFAYKAAEEALIDSVVKTGQIVETDNVSLRNPVCYHKGLVKVGIRWATIIYTPKFDTSHTY